ncbi:hypothetical protein SUDANB120_05684 [Streptomyces sp. enrichment culture]|uniref:hypothetical protein n=1 Tax=Streptomyces sp. enrichment culture TaxID=1795815 RepID=UPI003F54AFE6
MDVRGGVAGGYRLAAAEAVARAAGELIGGDGGSVPEYEALLDAVVRLAGRDRAALAAALQPVVEQWPGPYQPQAAAARRLLAVVRSAAGPVEPGPAEPSRFLETCQHEAVDVLLAARAGEVCSLLRRGVAVPMLLATSDSADGTLDPRELVMRLTEYEQAGARPGPADLGQALLRCGGGPADPDVVAAAEELELPEGQRVAAWLRAGGLPQPELTVEREPGEPEPPSRRRRARVGRRILVGTGELPGRGDFPRPFWSLFRRFEPMIGCNHLLLRSRERHAAAALPWHPEIVASRLLAQVAATADQNGSGDGSPDFLPALARSAGPAGPAVHLAVAYGLGARPDPARAAAVEALAGLAARGRLDGALLGAHVARLVLLGTLKLPVVTASLREAAGASGGAAAVWPVVAAALPELLAPPGSGGPVRPHVPLLALAADCAAACGARGTVPGVDTLATRPGSAPSTREARRLHTTLTAPV